MPRRFARWRLENFVEMRDKTADRMFQATRRVENMMMAKFPGKFRNRYAMVSYGGDGNVSYNNALRIGPLPEYMICH